MPNADPLSTIIHKYCPIGFVILKTRIQVTPPCTQRAFRCMKSGAQLCELIKNCICTEIRGGDIFKEIIDEGDCASRCNLEFYRIDSARKHNNFPSRGKGSKDCLHKLVLWDGIAFQLLHAAVLNTYGPHSLHISRLIESCILTLIYALL